jgi:hypothetical protein
MNNILTSLRAHHFIECSKIFLFLCSLVFFFGCVHKFEAISRNTSQFAEVFADLEKKCSAQSETVVVISTQNVSELEGLFNANKDNFSAQVLGPLGISLAQIQLTEGQPAIITSRFQPTPKSQDLGSLLQLAEKLGPVGLHEMLCGSFFTHPTKGILLQSKPNESEFELTFGEERINMAVNATIESNTLYFQARFFKSFWFFEKDVLQAIWQGNKVNEAWVPDNIQILSDQEDTVKVLEWTVRGK